MRKRLGFFVLAALVALAGLRDASAYTLGPNSIGIYGVETPVFDGYNAWYDLTCTPPVTGITTLYVVLLDPFNFGDSHPIDHVGGYEFRVEYPANVFVSPSLPPSAINFQTAPDFYCGANLPVVNGQALLVTLTVGRYDLEASEFYVTPVSDPNTQTIPGSIAITDFDDEFSIAEAYPASESFTEPVFRFDVCEPHYPDYDWYVTLTALGDENVAATHAQATDGFDLGLDEVDANTSVTFVRSEWGEPDLYYRTDVRAAYDPLSQAKTWPFRVNVPIQSGVSSITLDLFASFDPAVDFDAVLTDVTGSQTVDLAATNTYSWDSSGGARLFELTIGTESGGDTPFTIGWEATLPTLEDTGNIVGTNNVASDGFDPLWDVPEPGPPPTDYLVASVERQGWPLGPRFQRDMQAIYDPLAATKSWPLLVETDQQSGQVRLAFAPDFDEASGIAMMLRDEQSGELYSLFPSLEYHFDVGAAVNYRFTLLVGARPLPDLTPEWRLVPGGWSLIAPPLAAPGYGLEDVFALAPAPAYAFAYQPGDPGSYQRIYGSEPFTPGLGRWLAVIDEFYWTMEGAPQELPTELVLAPGWNLVGYPLWFPGPVESVQVIHGGTTLGFEEALAAGWVTAFMDYDEASGDYAATVGLEAWHAYWIAALTTDVRLRFDWQEFTVMPARLSEPKDLPLPPAKDWRCLLVLDDGTEQSRQAVFGVRDGATDGFDAAWDHPRPPASPGGGASLAIVRPERDKPLLRTLAQDLVAPLKEDPVSWTVRITPAKAGSVELRWARMGWPEDLDFQLYIPHENRVVVRSLRETAGVTLEVGDLPLDVVVRTPSDLSDAGDAPFAGYRLAVAPNPFNPRATLSFALPHAGAAAVKIYNVRGQLVADLDAGVLPAGPARVVWEGRDRRGQGVSSGVYFARLHVDGRAVGETVRLSLVR